MKTHFEGTLTIQDRKQHLPYAFEVPDGITRLEIHFRYQSAEPRLNNLSLSLFDPRGFRGAGHRHAEEHRILITPTEATPGYEPGPIVAGTWTIVVDTHMIVAGAPCQFQLDILLFSEAPEIGKVQFTPGHTAPRGTGWYRGDLHGHTIHSDGSWDVPDLVRYAREYKLNFVTLTDHNTTSPLAQMDSLSSDDLLTMGGMELTTFYGHALGLGLRQWIDWRVQPDTRTMPMIVEEVTRAGGVFVIAHPKSIGDPVCTGCDWTYGDMLPGPARLVEIWNGLWEGPSNNDDALAMWYSWLNEGRRIVATAGTDIHGPLASYERPGFNVVYAESLSEKALLEAIQNGHLYLSEGPRLEVIASSSSGARAMMGDLIEGNVTEIKVSWSGTTSTDRVCIVVDGLMKNETAAQEAGETTLKLDSKTARWCTVEIRHASGHVRAISNPIFLHSFSG